MAKDNRNLFLSLLGIVLLLSYLNYYGLQTLVDELRGVGVGVLWISLTFIPTLCLYSLAWMLCTDLRANKQLSLPNFLMMMATSISWNNLTPFLKIGGEFIKVIMIQRVVSKRESIRSVVSYNLVHILGTIGAFAVALLLLPLYLKDNAKWAIFSLIGAFVGFAFIVATTLWAKSIRKLFPRQISRDRTFLRSVVVNLTSAALLLQKKRKRAILAILLEVAARWVEGLTFYFAFQLVKAPIGFWDASFLQVVRALGDNLLFFIPHQVGVREVSVEFVMQSIMQLPTSGSLSVVLLSRWVEISWILLGYAIWIFYFAPKKKSPHKKLVIQRQS